MGPRPGVDLHGVAHVWDQELDGEDWRGWLMETVLGSFLIREWHPTCWTSLLLMLFSLSLPLHAGLLLLL